MNAPTLLPEHVWRSAEFPLCTINVPVDKLALKFGFPLVEWEESGLGSASGFTCKLASGLVLLLEELAHSRERLGASGPTIYVEVNALVTEGVERSIASVLAGLGLTPQNITWSQDGAGLQSAKRYVQAAQGGAAPRDDA